MLIHKIPTVDTFDPQDSDTVSRSWYSSDTEENRLTVVKDTFSHKRVVSGRQFQCFVMSTLCDKHLLATGFILPMFLAHLVFQFIFVLGLSGVTKKHIQVHSVKTHIFHKYQLHMSLVHNSLIINCVSIELFLRR